MITSSEKIEGKGKWGKGEKEENNLFALFPF